MIHQLKSVQEFQYLMSEVPYQLIVLDFTASWCGPCHRIAPYFEKLSHENPNVIFYRIDIDEYPEIATQLNVSSVPNFVFICNGKVCHQFAGADTKMLNDVISQLSLKIDNLKNQQQIQQQVNFPISDSQ